MLMTQPNNVSKNVLINLGLTLRM